MERQEFEDSWKEAFKDSEVIPSDNVWTNVELDLERAKAVALRKRLVRYQWLAAASIMFSIGIGLSDFLSTPVNEEKLALKPSTEKINSAQNSHVQKTVPREKAPEVESAEVKSADKAMAESKVLNEPKQIAAGNTTNSLQIESHAGVNTQSAQKNISTPLAIQQDATSVASVDGGESRNIDPSSSTLSNNALPLDKPSLEFILDKEAKLVVVSAPSIPTAAKNEVDPVVAMMQKLEQREKELAQTEETKDQEKIKKSSEKFWSSVGFAAGSFKSVNSGASASLAGVATNTAYASSIANQETKASGVTYSMGVNLGTKITERWVFQGGVNYLNQTSEYTQQTLIQNTQNFTAFRPASINELNQLAASDAPAQKSAIASAPYDVNNNVRYLSVPLQAGYMIINRGVGLQMNAGVSTDLFLQNTVRATSDGEKVDAVKAGIGQSTAFKPVNFSGLMGTELSYRFGKHYRVAVNPGVRYPFSNIYKSDYYKASRLTFDIGLRFRYIFR